MLIPDPPIAGCPLDIYVDDEIEAIDSYLRFQKFLHIGKTDIVASQYVEVKPKGSSWQILKEKESESIFRGVFIPLLKALAREIEMKNASCKDEISPNFWIYYPVLVLKGPLLEYYVPPNGPAVLRKSNHILIIRHYVSENIKCICAIDVIHESYLEQYLAIIQKEAKQFINRVRRNKKVVMESFHKSAEINGKEEEAVQDDETGD